MMTNALTIKFSARSVQLQQCSLGQACRSDLYVAQAHHVSIMPATSTVLNRFRSCEPECKVAVTARRTLLVTQQMSVLGACKDGSWPLGSRSRRHWDGRNPECLPLASW